MTNGMNRGNANGTTGPSIDGDHDPDFEIDRGLDLGHDERIAASNLATWETTT